MKSKNQKQPLPETTKDDSSDVQKVNQDKQCPPPQPKANSKQNRSQEDEDAQKGHS